MFCSSLLPGSQTYLTAQIIQWHFFLCKQICVLATLTPWSWFCLDPEGVYFFKASLWIFEALMIGLPQTALPAVPSPDQGWTLRKERKRKVQALESLPSRTSFIDTEQDGPQTGELKKLRLLSRRNLEPCTTWESLGGVQRHQGMSLSQQGAWLCHLKTQSDSRGCHLNGHCSIGEGTPVLCPLGREK